MLTYLYVHPSGRGTQVSRLGTGTFIPMPVIFFLSVLASHEPVHWTIKCDQWSELAVEVMQDEYLDDRSKSDLINYFATKVEEEGCFRDAKAD